MLLLLVCSTVVGCVRRGGVTVIDKNEVFVKVFVDNELYLVECQHESDVAG